MSQFNHASSLLHKQPQSAALSARPSLDAANTLPDLGGRGSTRSISSAATLPVGSPPGTDPQLHPADAYPRGSSATTIPVPTSPSPTNPVSSGLFGRPRPSTRTPASQSLEHSVATRETILLPPLPGRSRQTPGSNLKNDPFLTHLKESQPTEETPLFPPSDAPKFRSRIGSRIVEDDAKLLVLPLCCCMLLQTAVSGVILSSSFDETGHRPGYEEGHLDPEDQHSGCQAAYLWLLMQAFCDLFITLMSCILLLIPLKSDPVSFHGCIAVLRLCTLSAGFHILYFSGLKRDLCDPSLIVWCTIITWFGIGVMALVSCYLLSLLLGSPGKTRRGVPRLDTQVKSHGPPIPEKSKLTYTTAYSQMSRAPP